MPVTSKKSRRKRYIAIQECFGAPTLFREDRVNVLKTVGIAENQKNPRKERDALGGGAETGRLADLSACLCRLCPLTKGRLETLLF